MRLRDKIGVINAFHRQNLGDTNRVDADYRIFMRSFAKVVIPHRAPTISGGRHREMAARAPPVKSCVLWPPCREAAPRVEAGQEAA